ncbi:molybdopterin-binding protein [Vulcanisaeta thermophila]|uniref:molybdopterin-binding protein n=1 Tax=Vulcanisaeta thermophila TaxID=867917 RepID=UPI000852F594|nr:molybdopterin-binding protein [Vulcanisaeta thermophila]
MRLVRVEDAVGLVLGYDTTYVSRDGATVLLPRGHVITQEDVERLKDSGVYFVWVQGDEESSELMYEWEVAEAVARSLAGGNIEVKPARQGSALLVSRVPGVLRVNVDALVRFNMNGNVLLITKHNHTAVGSGEVVGVVDVIPLSMHRKDVEGLLGFGTIIDVVPFRLRRVGVVITGTEIYQGRKRDLYMPVIRSKAERYGWDIVYSRVVPDDEDEIISAIRDAVGRGAEVVIITGGMSVDPTDKTPLAIRKLGAQVLFYGLPIKPTTMSMAALWNGVVLFGVSAGGIYYSEHNAIDIVLTRIMAGMIPSREEVAALGHGGLLTELQHHMKG